MLENILMSNWLYVAIAVDAIVLLWVIMGRKIWSKLHVKKNNLI
jgi:cadmium resistance protein CadD (predicted permease)